MAILANAVYWVALLAFYILWARVILDFIRQLRPDWKPKGVMLAISVALLRDTDPVLRFARRIIKPVRVGGAMIDFAMLSVMLVLLVILWIAGAWA